MFTCSKVFNRFTENTVTTYHAVSDGCRSYTVFQNVQRICTQRELNFITCVFMLVELLHVTVGPLNQQITSKAVRKF